MPVMVVVIAQFATSFGEAAVMITLFKSIASDGPLGAGAGGGGGGCGAGDGAGCAAG